MQRKILVVDDVEIERNILENILKPDYEVLQASDGKEALSILERDGNTISAMILDLVMPTMNGYELLEAMRGNEELSQVPVLVTTGETSDGAEVRALTLGANDYITKPYNPDIIKHRVDNTIKLRETASTVNALSHDELTGLCSRRVFNHRAASMIASHNSDYYVMASFNINNFKFINDRYGIDKGDSLLISLANIFRSSFEPIGGLSCRMSADCFAALYPKTLLDSPKMNDVQEAIGALVSSIPHLTYRCGRYLVDDPTLSIQAIYDRAVMAQDSIKGRADISIAYFDDSMRERVLSEKEITQEMTVALARGQFETWLQPQYDHSTGALIGAEILVRWQHPVKGLILPAEFIPVFERNGFIYEMDKYIWRQSCVLLRRWLDEGWQPLPLSVNVSHHDLVQDDLLKTFDELLGQYDVPIELLRLEIAEATLANSSGAETAIIEQLSKRGFTIEIDDFGSSLSSLNTLKDIPADILILDMRFLESNNNGERGGFIVESIVRMAKWLGMPIIAEGVETIEQADYLKSIGCNYLQGYLYARPMPVEEYESLVGHKQRKTRLLTLDAATSIDGDSLWNPESMDTLIFNSYVGGASIFEYCDGSIELLRATEKFIELIGAKNATIKDVLAFSWSDCLCDIDRQALQEAILESARTSEEITGEYQFIGLPGCPRRTVLKISLRVIASTDNRYLVYCINENVTSRIQVENALRMSEEQFRIAAMLGGKSIARYDIKTCDYFNNNEELFNQGFGKRIPDVPQTFIEQNMVLTSSIDDVRAYFDSMRSGVQECSATFALRMPNAEFRWFKSHATIVFDEEEEPSWAIIVFHDVTDEREREAVYRKWRQSLEQRHPQSYTLLRFNLTENTPSGIAVGMLLETDFGGEGQMFDQRMHAYVNDFVHPKDRSAFLLSANGDSLLAAYHRNKRRRSVEYREITSKGQIRWISLTIELVEYPDSSDIEAYLMFEDIDKRKRAELFVKEFAEIDPLTGVFNRMMFETQFEKLVACAKPNSRQAFLLVNVDNFRLLNDSFGHAAGDQALIDIANALHALLRASDILGRLGGDEFLICLSDIDDDDVVRVATQIRDVVRKAYSLDVCLSASIGIALCPKDGSTFDILYRNADAALATIKKGDKDGFAVYDKQMVVPRITDSVEIEEPLVPQTSIYAPQLRRMLIVGNDSSDLDFLSQTFEGEFTIDRTSEIDEAYTRIQYYGTALAVVLLDFDNTGQDSFSLLRRMRSNQTLQTIPVIIIGSNVDLDMSLQAIEIGATDYVSKPLDVGLIKLRVQSAISKAENERLRAQNSCLLLENDEIARYRTVLRNTGTVVIELDWITGIFTYDPSISRFIEGNYDNRRLWQILLQDLVANGRDVQKMQTLTHSIADDRLRDRGSAEVMLKTPSRAIHRFRVCVYKQTNEFQLTDKIILTFNDLDQPDYLDEPDLSTR